MTDLFTIPESKSPRLLWMERHGVQTSSDPTNKSYWMAHGSRKGSGFGSTEEDAIIQYALCAGIKLWNEEST